MTKSSRPRPGSLDVKLSGAEVRREGQGGPRGRGPSASRDLTSGQTDSPDGLQSLSGVSVRGSPGFGHTEVTLVGLSRNIEIPEVEGDRSFLGTTRPHPGRDRVVRYGIDPVPQGPRPLPEGDLGHGTENLSAYGPWDSVGGPNTPGERDPGSKKTPTTESTLTHPRTYTPRSPICVDMCVCVHTRDFSVHPTPHFPHPTSDRETRRKKAFS